MGLTSAAEAKLDARVRPQITELRLRTPYPKRRSDAEPQPAQPPATPSPAPAQLTSARSARPTSARPTSAWSTSTRRAPIRLTRRGRIVVWTLAGFAVAAVAGLIWLAITGQAQASGQAGPARSATSGVARVVVRSGQTLWGIAAQVDPNADPRVVIPQIVELNSLRGTSISVGQVLWVPRS
jgi:nucleoid-associated protein YgaU